MESVEARKGRGDGLGRESRGGTDWLDDNRGYGDAAGRWERRRRRGLGVEGGSVVSRSGV